MDLEYYEVQVSGKSKNISNFVDDLELRGKGISEKLEVSTFDSMDTVKVECWIECDLIQKLSEFVEDLASDNNIKIVG